MFWKITDEDVVAAQGGNAAATERLYAAALPPCVRLAGSLCGSDAAAGRVMRRLVDRSATQLSDSRSRDGEAAGRWFAHQTVLLTRTEPQPIDTTQDTLMSGVGGPDVVAYQALVAGLRKLSRQQQEALILHKVHGWNPRLCAVAMDCSTQAVETHLNEATRLLTPLADGHFEALIGAMRQVHQTRPADLPQSPATLAARVVRRRWVARVLTLTAWVATIALLAGVVWLVYQFAGRIKI